MNEKFAHTPGKLVVSSIGVGFELESEAGEVIAQSQQVIAKDRMQGLAIRKENARRIAACWNALDGLSTEHLESFMGAVIAKGGFIGLWSNYCDLKDQRAELIEALQELMNGVEDTRGIEVEDCWSKQFAKARAAIAKATGKTSEAA